MNFIYRLIKLTLAMYLLIAPGLFSSCDKETPDNLGIKNEQNSNVSDNKHFALEKIEEYKVFCDPETNTRLSDMESTIFSNPSYTSNSNYSWLLLNSYNNGNQEISYTYDSKKNIVINEFYKNTYTLNAKGLIEKKIQEHNGSCPDYTTTYSYDSKNRLTNIYLDAQEEGWESYTITYDNTNNISKITKEHEIGGTYSSSTEEFDYDNTPLDGTINLKKRMPRYVLSFLYDYEQPLLEQGLFGPLMPVDLIKSIRDADTNKLLSEYFYSYNEYGNIKKLIKSSYSPTETIWRTYTFTWEEVSQSTYEDWLFSNQISPFFKSSFYKNC